MIITLRVISIGLTMLGTFALYLVGSLALAQLILTAVGGLVIMENLMLVALLVMCAFTGYHTAQRMTD